MTLDVPINATFAEGENVQMLPVEFLDVLLKVTRAGAQTGVGTVKLASAVAESATIICLETRIAAAQYSLLRLKVTL